MGQWFEAERGRGARLNGRAISVSTTARLNQAFLVTGFPYDIHTSGTNLCEFSRLARRALAIRRDGAAALDLAYVAAGKFDGFWEASLKPWDVAAGRLLVTEAGGTISTWSGRRAYAWGDPMLATNGAIQRAMRRILRAGGCDCPPQTMLPSAVVQLSPAAREVR